MVEPDFDKDTEPKTQTDEKTQKSFTSWKMDILDAMSMAPNISAGEFRVAFRLMQHVNSESGAIYPSQLAIADQIGTRPKQVSIYINRLIEKGWLHKQRKNRQTTNRYSFDPKNINAVLDIQSSRKEWRQEQRQKQLSDRSKIAPQKSLTGAISTFHRGAISTFPTGAIAPLNTLREHLKGTPKKERGIELPNSNSDTREASQSTKGIESDANQKAIAINAEPFSQASDRGTPIETILQKPVFSLIKKMEVVDD